MILTWEMRRYDSWVTSSSSEVKSSSKSVWCPRWFLRVSAWYVRLLSGESREVRHKKKVGVTSENIIEKPRLLIYQERRCRPGPYISVGCLPKASVMLDMFFSMWSIRSLRAWRDNSCSKSSEKPSVFQGAGFSRCREPCFDWVRWKERPPQAEHMKSALSNDHVLALFKNPFVQQSQMPLWIVSWTVTAIIPFSLTV